MNPRVRALGETVLRVKDLERVKRFYTDVIGLGVLREFDGITFHDPEGNVLELVCYDEAIE